MGRANEQAQESPSRRRRYLRGFDIVSWALLAALACFVKQSVSVPAPLAITLLLAGTQLLGSLLLAFRALQTLPPAADVAWREQLAIAGIAERTWWRSMLAPLLLRAFLPVAAMQTILMAWFAAVHMSMDWNDLWTLACLGFALPASGCLVAAWGTMRTFKALCRPGGLRGGVVLPTVIWAAAGASLPAAVILSCIALRIEEDAASLASAVLFVAALAVTVRCWRHGWRGIFAFE